MKLDIEEEFDRQLITQNGKWIDEKKMLKLGWCWDRNPHTWLGSASAKIRIG